MSPTATIATVIVALVFFAWLFQSDNKDDPAYQAYLRKLQDEKAKLQERVVGTGITAGHSGVEKANGIETEDPSTGGNTNPLTGNGNVTTAGFNTGPGSGEPSELNGSTDPLKNGGKPGKPEDGFPLGAKIDGLYVAVEYIGDPAVTGPQASSITFRRDGTFSTQNMSLADIGMELAGAGETVDRGSGRYKLHKRTLVLSYTDGLTRRNGNQRSFTIVPVLGENDQPGAITIQGKVFKLVPQ